MASQRVQNLAQRLVRHEASSEGSPSSEPSEFRVSARLRDSLSSLMGKAGFQALLTRALTLTRPEFPQLGAVKVNPDGYLEGMAEILPALTPQQIIQTETALVSHIIDLLCTFLGEALTVRLLQDVLPDASFNESDPRKETTA